MPCESKDANLQKAIFVFLPAGGLFRDKSTGSSNASTINHEIINKSVLDLLNARCLWFLPQNAGFYKTKPNIISSVTSRFIYFRQL